MGLSLLAAVTLPGPAFGQEGPPARGARPMPIRAEQLKREDFDRLPDQQEIEVQGRKMTAGEVRARMREQAAAAEAKARQGTAEARAKFEASRTKFLQDQKAKVEAANAKVRAQFASRRSKAARPATSPQFQAIRQEAIQLSQRSKTASPAEQAQIEARAAELLGQLQQMGVAVTIPAQEVQPAGTPPRRLEQKSRPAPGAAPELHPATPLPARPGPGGR